MARSISRSYDWEKNEYQTEIKLLLKKVLVKMMIHAV